MASTAQKKKPAGKQSAASAPRSGQNPKKGQSQKQPSAASRRVPAGNSHPGVWAAVCVFLGLFCLVGCFSVDALLINPVCGFLKGLLGYGYYTLPPALVGAGVILAVVRDGSGPRRAGLLTAVPLLAGALIHVIAAPELYPVSNRLGDMIRVLYTSGKEIRSGGAAAGLLGWGSKRLLSIFLALPLLAAGLAALLMGAFHVSARTLAERFSQRRWERYEAGPDPEPDLEPEPAGRRSGLRQQDAAAAGAGALPRSGARSARRAIDVPMDGDEPAPVRQEKPGFFNANPRVRTPAQFFEQTEPAPAPTPEESLPYDLTEEAKPAAPKEPEAPVGSSPFGLRQKRGLSKSSGRPEAEPATPASVPEALQGAPTSAAPETPASGGSTGTENVKPLSVEEAAETAGVVLQSPGSDPVKVEEFSSEVVRSMRAGGKKGIDTEELIHETAAVARAVEQKDAALASEPDYRFPPVALLHAGSSSGPDGREEMRINSERLQSTLDSFGVNAVLCDVTRGPTVTRYDLELEAGVKLAKLTNLAGDLALALGVTGVRIAPIPDKISTVGVEVPNKIVSMVYLRDIIDTPTFSGASSKLTIALGKDIGGNAIVGNISKLPHLLIAGTTGSGKSVCMNCLILSLLYKATPEEVRLIMIDPKMVELGIYNGIPHLYIPVVTDPKKAAGSLQWSVVEMLKRYRLFSEAGIRDLASYNAIKRRNGEPTLPQVVIVIDELADLMMVASKEVEESICRVAQMGRAAGMHLVIATQRPSADVITGLMKANIPSRVAFAVSSSIDSRIILDQVGAEKLIGYGDMLFAPIGIGKPSRIQGAFVTDEEREEIVSYIKRNGAPEYNQEIMSTMEQAAADRGDKTGGAKAESVDAAPEDGSFDELLPQAVDVIFETKQASVSLLQRRLKLGYSRAARIVDQMEQIGVVGPFEGSKPRQILLTREQWLEMQTVQGTAPTERTGFADYRDAPPEEWQS